MKKVVVAMSGGVDSSVAAALLKEQGYDLIGITMNLACTSQASDRGCCSLSAAQDAKKVADKLGIPHYILNFKEEFQKWVIDNFIGEYKNGRTPNPCIRCNQFIKFDLLLRRAKELGAEYIATGHYAKIMTNDKCLMSNESIKYILLKGKDPKKDQSYVLYRMTQEQLAQTLFPLGDLTKEKVRKIAKELNLPVADKAESQEICFVEDDDYSRFLKERIPECVRPGPILNSSGKNIGTHEGIIFYTIGQRKGIGAHGRKKYVIGLNVRKNAVIIGDNSDLLELELTASRVNYISGRTPAKKLEISAKIRYNSPAAAAKLSFLKGGKVKVLFKEPQRAITPGQSVVFYQGDEVLGGGIIEKGGK
jgi:tRNA-specific 2-thiouridylase